MVKEGRFEVKVRFWLKSFDALRGGLLKKLHQRFISKQRISSEMEVAPRYTLFTLLTLLA